MEGKGGCGAKCFSIAVPLLTGGLALGHAPTGSEIELRAFFAGGGINADTGPGEQWRINLVMSTFSGMRPTARQ